MDIATLVGGKLAPAIQQERVTVLGLGGRGRGRGHTSGTPIIISRGLNLCILAYWVQWRDKFSNKLINYVYWEESNFMVKTPHSLGVQWRDLIHERLGTTALAVSSLCCCLSHSL